MTKTKYIKIVEWEWVNIHTVVLGLFTLIAFVLQQAALWNSDFSIAIASAKVIGACVIMYLVISRALAKVYWEKVIE